MNKSYITNDYDISRIKEDAHIARDALESLIIAEPLDVRYIHEKLEIVRRCIYFIESFEEVYK